MKYAHLLLSLMLIMLISTLAAQTSQPTIPTVSISAETHINDALQILETFSIQQTKKKIINLSAYNSSINIPIHNLTWENALGLILLQNNLIKQDHVGYISIENIPVPIPKAIPVEPDVVVAKNKQVRIQAVAMLVDKAYLQSLGIDWSTIFNGKVVVNAGFLGAAQVPSTLASLSGSGDLKVNGTRIEVSTLLKTIESDQKGNILAKPNIMVSSGKRGYIQVGQDVSVKTVDDAGNTMDTFFATGIILDVLPTVVTVDGVELINLKLSIERSSASPGNVSTIINKSKSDTELTLYNGEETVIGGLYDTDEIRLRGGVPLLKDLPWWVFGFRYLFGYYKYEKKERELVIMMKADTMHSAGERFQEASQDIPPK